MPSRGAEQWIAFGTVLNACGTVLLACGAVCAGMWALYNYQKNRRSDAVRWLTGVFHDFYLANRFTNVRQVLEYNFDSVAGPLLERRVIDRHVPVSASELELLKELDDLLNYFEYVLYLEHHLPQPLYLVPVPRECYAARPAAQA